MRFKNIGLAHDSLTQLGGAERVLQDLSEALPDSPIFTLASNEQTKSSFKNKTIKTSVLQYFYRIYPKFQHLFPFIPLAVSGMDFKGFDLIVSSSSGFVKNIYVPKNCVHVDYCHTPPRFLWDNEEYINQEVPKILRPLASWILNRFKAWDIKGSERVNYFLANSKEVQGRIKKIYNKDSTVIYPGVDTEFWKPTIPKQNYFLIAGRLQAYKKNDFIVEVFNELGLPLHVVGTGRQEQYLRSIAKGNVRFFGRISDEELRDQYSGALGLIYPQYEDLGMIPLEAAACGTSSLALAKGGSLETVVPGVTGEFFSGYEKEKVKQIILNWDTKKYETEKLIQHARSFSKTRFKEEILKFLNSI